MSDSTIVLYHAACADGFGAAFAAWTVLKDSAVYIPVQYGQPYPPEIEGGVARLFILDFSYPRAVLGRLAECASEILVLDHHKTAREELEGLPFARFDLEKSGAVLAWEHFHPGEGVPMLLRYVQDRDLWRWELPASREFSARLAATPRAFDHWEYLLNVAENESARVQFCREGGAILLAQRVHVATLCDRAYWTEVDGHRVPCVNTPLFQSEVGEELCRRHPDAPFAAVFSAGEGEEYWSLRARGGFDVSAVAKRLGGGGHPAAAGFERARRG
jgi:uncharacterized protein